MKILLADDSRAMRTVFRSVLERLGYARGDILEAKDAREVQSAFQNPDFTIDLIVFDWDLPGMDGLGLMGRLKALGLTGKVSVLLSVNRQQRALLSQAARMGPCESIDRPFTEETFEMKFRSLGLSITGKKGETSRTRAIPPM